MFHFLISTLLTFISFSSVVVGDPEVQADFIRTTYEEHLEEVRQILLDLEQNEVKWGSVDLCIDLRKYIVELGYIEDQQIDVSGQIIHGVFDGNEGYKLILDDFSTINIPGLIKCTARKKDNKDLVIGGKAFLYFYALYKKGNEFKCARVEIFDESKPPTVIRLKRLELIDQYLKTYNTNYEARRPVERWFKKAEKKKQMAIDKCINLSTLGRISEDGDEKWEIVNGEAVIGKFNLRLTKNMGIKLIGILKCKVKLKNSPSNDIKVKYFAANFNSELSFSFVWSPKKIGVNCTFAIHPELIRDAS